MNIDPRVLPTIAVIALVSTAWMLRFDVTTPGGTESRAGFVLLDRWTGTIRYCTGVRCADVEMSR